MAYHDQVENMESEGTQVLDTLIVDPDMRHMLDLLKKFYVTDEGHVIRSLLRERLKEISALSILE